MQAEWMAQQAEFQKMMKQQREELAAQKQEMLKHVADMQAAQEEQLRRQKEQLEQQFLVAKAQQDKEVEQKLAAAAKVQAEMQRKVEEAEAAAKQLAEQASKGESLEDPLDLEVEMVDADAEEQEESWAIQLLQQAAGETQDKSGTAAADKAAKKKEEDKKKQTKQQETKEAKEDKKQEPKQESKQDEEQHKGKNKKGDNDKKNHGNDNKAKGGGKGRGPADRVVCKGLGMVMKDVRRMMDEIEFTFIFPADNKPARKLIDIKKLWKSKMPKKGSHPMGPERMPLTPYILEWMLRTFTQRHKELSQVYPELVEPASRGGEIVTAVAKSPKVMTKMIRHATTKEISEDRVLLKMAPGHGFITPPFWPTRVEARTVVLFFAELMEEFKTDSPGPRTGLEREINKMAGWD